MKDRAGIVCKTMQKRIDLTELNYLVENPHGRLPPLRLASLGLVHSIGLLIVLFYSLPGAFQVRSYVQRQTGTGVGRGSTSHV